MGILQAEAKITRQFQLRWSCLLPMSGADASTKEGSQQKTDRECGLPFVGSPCWTRTSDTLINSQVLYRLS